MVSLLDQENQGSIQIPSDVNPASQNAIRTNVRPIQSANQEAFRVQLGAKLGLSSKPPRWVATAL